MTFTVIALSQDGMQLGVATATCTLAVGNAVPAAAPGVGALATQAFTNRTFRSHTLELLRAGNPPAEVVELLRATDPGFESRQLGIVDRHGSVALHTGADCSAWAGGLVLPRAALVGNLLAGPQVLQAMANTFEREHRQPFAARLVDALLAGESAGGDVRGRQSAAVYVVSNADADVWPPETVTDLRVDDHGDPVGELRRLVDLHHQAALGIPGVAVPALG